MTGVIHISGAVSWRGGEQQLWYLAGELREHGIRQAILCPAGSPLARKAQAAGILTRTYRKTGALNVQAARQLRSVVKEISATVIHAHDSHGHSIAILSAVLVGNKVPVIVSRRVDFAPGTSFLSRYKYNHPAVARIICVSDKIHRVMARYLDDPLRLVTIHSGIDTDRFPYTSRTGYLREEFHLGPGDILIGNTSAIAVHKDYFTFLDTAAILVSQDPRFRFFIIGDGDLRQKVQAYLEAKGLQDKVIMTGFREDIPRILPDLDVFLMTSTTEGLGTTILDAFACKVPVVATAAGGIPEMVIDGHTGLLAPVRDPEALASCIMRVAGDKELTSALTRSAYESLSHFSKENTARETMIIYEAVEALTR